ncbi:hypothetical protein Slin15195_G115730 [Septoria linicola]|uniref:Uncharacterized protein n=1 Tax=Septoria linicola TaxID=215465 RepID=A0A9Q9AZU5_9PEZI|nr:hypothetical protein Slin14017_G092750 [Septoria linicola]USW58254.1 hypothetical protein Slin15195_G115730 [Septoria linicola]
MPPARKNYPARRTARQQYVAGQKLRAARQKTAASARDSKPEQDAWFSGRVLSPWGDSSTDGTEEDDTSSRSGRAASVDLDESTLGSDNKKSSTEGSTEPDSTSQHSLAEVSWTGSKCRSKPESSSDSQECVPSDGTDGELTGRGCAISARFRRSDVGYDGNADPVPVPERDPRKSRVVAVKNFDLGMSGWASVSKKERNRMPRRVRT